MVQSGRRRDDPDVHRPTIHAAGDWRTFASGHYRAFHSASVGQGAVSALAGGAVTTPLLLQLGARPALAMAIAILPALGSLTQLVALPRRVVGEPGFEPGTSRI